MVLVSPSRVSTISCMPASGLGVRGRVRVRVEDRVGVRVGVRVRVRIG